MPKKGSRKGGVWVKKSHRVFQGTVNGQKVTLCRIECGIDEAYRRLAELRGESQKDEVVKQGATVQAVVQGFLETSQVLSPRIYPTHKSCLTRFCASYGECQAEKTTELMVQQWVQDHPEWSSGTVRAYISHIQAAFQWGLDNGLIQKHPVRKMGKPAQTSRSDECLISVDEHQLFLSVANPNLQDVLVMLYETGARPIDISRITRRDCHLEGKNPCVKLYLHKTAMKTGEAKVIALTDRSVEVCRKLCHLHTTGPIFRTNYGNPWRTDGLDLKFRRLKDRLIKQGHPINPKATPYGYKHQMAHELLMNGTPLGVVKEILGHRSIQTTIRHYGHLSSDRNVITQIVQNRGRSEDGKSNDVKPQTESSE